MIRTALGALTVIMGTTLYFTALNTSDTHAWHMGLAILTGIAIGILLTLEWVASGKGPKP